MNNIITKGAATKDYVAENISLKITFRKKGDEANYILGSVMKQCENFIEKLNEINIKPEDVQVIDQGINKSYGEELYCAERQLVLETAIDVRLCSYIFSLIKQCGKDITYNFSYSVNDYEAKSNELIALAVNDSKRQAETIAASLGKKVVGIESVNDDRYMQRTISKALAVDKSNPKIPEAFESDTPLTDRAALPTISMNEEIKISWLMGD